MNARRVVAALAVVLSAVTAADASAQGYGGPMPFESALGDLAGRAADWGGSVADTASTGVRDAMGAPAEAHRQVSEGREAAETAAEGASALSDLDRELDHALDQPEPGTPPVPSSCVGREGCAECFGRTYLQLARSRVLLARARALYDATHRFSTAAQAVGNSLAPSTREAAFVWEFQKPRIAESLKAFDQTYDRKIADMLAALRRNLQEIGECEAQFYNNPDWYQRYAFIYFEFMKSRYER